MSISCHKVTIFALKDVGYSISAVLFAFIVAPRIVEVVVMAIGLAAIAANKGIAFANGPVSEAYLENLGISSQSLTILTTCGVLALVIWSRTKDLHLFQTSNCVYDVSCGVITGIVNYFASIWIILPWTHFVFPVDSAWPIKQYSSLAGLGGIYMTRISETFFVDIVYSPIAETVVFIGFLYRALRIHLNGLLSIILCATIIAVTHQNQVLFWKFFVFAIFNCCLYESRKSIAPSVFHHITYNSIVYGSQLFAFK